ncbi:ArsR/SmtB family transcription factor [Rhodohalobacter mucosus]|uniref:Transcriptional regulator n=1 Tax=Rhodohalobacter mucosus TaxID=2079485 RepID=A0A316TQW3_9BACT|nr:metalloregulator ArsR/SmtB family transcription factor [Rhodohalobacter mucosus]PWN05415.1 transcriptional regulator [Rhodohalobacter mucosus]
MISSSEQFEPVSLAYARYADALSHPARLTVLEKLAELGVATCGELTGMLPLAQPTVSQHLKKLVDSGLVQRRKSGLKSLYSLNEEAVQEYRSLSFGLLNKLSNPLN